MQNYQQSKEKPKAIKEFVTHTHSHTHIYVNKHTVNFALTDVKKTSIANEWHRVQELLWMRAPLVNQLSTSERACPVQISAVIVTEMYKSIHSPSSGSNTMTKLPRKDNHVCKSNVQTIYGRNPKVIQERERDICYCSREKYQLWENKKKCLTVSLSLTQNYFYEHARSELLCEHFWNICLKR